MFSVLGLDHVVLAVADKERAIAFYTEVLGCAVEREVESIGLVQLRAGNSLIDIVPADSCTLANQNMDHFCLRIEPFNVEELVEHFDRYAIKIGEPARRYGAEGYGQSVYLQDPDGNCVELKGPPELAG